MYCITLARPYYTIQSFFKVVLLGAGDISCLIGYVRFLLWQNSRKSKYFTECKIKTEFLDLARF